MVLGRQIRGTKKALQQRSRGLRSGVQNAPRGPSLLQCQLECAIELRPYGKNALIDLAEDDNSRKASLGIAGDGRVENEDS